MIVNEGGGVRLPNLTNPAAASDLLINKQLIDAEGRIVNGTMPIVTHPNPSIIVGANGLITASHKQETGKVTGGTTQSTHQLTVQNGTTITPGTTQKIAVSAGKFTTGNVNVAGDSNLKASNIKSGISIFGVKGTYAASSGYNIKVATGLFDDRVVSSHIQTVWVDIPGTIRGLIAIDIKSPDALSDSITSDYWATDEYQVMWMHGFTPKNAPVSSLPLDRGFVQWKKSNGNFDYGPVGYSGIPTFNVNAEFYNYNDGTSSVGFVFEGGTDLWVYGTTSAPRGATITVVYAV